MPETAGAVGVLDIALLQTGLPEEARVLVARHGGHGNCPAQDRRIQHADGAGCVHHLRQAGFRDAQQLQQVVVPVLGMQVKKHGAPGVGGVRHVGMPLHQVPGQEAVRRTEDTSS